MAKPTHPRPAPHLTRGPHQAIRNPWLEGPSAPPSHGPGPGPGSHSSGSTMYDGYMPVYDQYAPEPPQPQIWRQPTATTPEYEVPEGGLQVPQTCTLPHQNTLRRTAQPANRPLTPGGLSHMSGSAGTAPGCGECDALDTWCYYCIQVVLGIAALAGVSLLIAAAVLKGQRPRAAASANLSSMPYIGAMLALVAGALLFVQLFARNEKKRKKRRLQQLREQRSIPTGLGGTLRRPVADAADLIPLQELHKFTAPNAPTIQSNFPVGPSPVHLTHQFQPLLSRPMMNQHQQPRPQDMLSPSGTPWWRRQQAHPGRVVYPS